MKQFLVWVAALTALAAVAACGQSNQESQSPPSTQQSETEPRAVQATQGHTHSKTELHGGTSAMTQAHHFEVVYLADGIRLYVYDDAQEPVSTGGIQGEVTLQYADGEVKPMALTHVPAEEIDGGMTANDYLFAKLDLSKSAPSSFDARFALTNLPGQGEAGAEFMRSYDGLTERPYMCPMHADVWGETAESECPLCGMPTDMMRPVKP